MLARLLFACVWLLIAAALLLPLYPGDASRPGATAPASALWLADATPFHCADCAVTAPGDPGCRTDCPCGQLLPAAFAPPASHVSLSLRVIARPLPVGLPPETRPLPPKPQPSDA